MSDDGPKNSATLELDYNDDDSDEDVVDFESEHLYHCSSQLPGLYGVIMDYILFLTPYLKGGTCICIMKAIQIKGTDR